MSVLTIRAYKRYATRLPVELHRPGRKTASGLLIELSQQGARISNLCRGKYEAGDILTISLPNGMEIEGTIRWAHDGLAGIRINRSLHLPEMRELLDLNRREQSGVEWRFGT
ncbi:PilZ domain-containing protein [Aurantiacibacter poecillastricola]|uniref:PilZ domain-containing protein n=1 Tax=Aurantiacibacter poecillastricola TaxID=3064385 RepID=UPI00273FC5FF|nr:PilZ domain-containing protein [Aurantiacibacter sp. 219JJ12-13]MDP5261814.1 PilZ domain-containing protein [Aurantiacibacter sp. 219JJ12-13]